MRQKLFHKFLDEYKVTLIFVKGEKEKNPKKNEGRSGVQFLKNHLCE